MVADSGRLSMPDPCKIRPPLRRCGRVILIGSVDEIRDPVVRCSGRSPAAERSTRAQIHDRERGPLGTRIEWPAPASRLYMDSDVLVTFCLTPSLGERAIEAFVEELSPDERARHDALVFARDRRDYAAAHALLRRTLSALSDVAPHEWCFASGIHGKPRLSPSLAERTHLSFNLAHTDGLVACAISQDREIGIDVEAIDRRIEAWNIADKFFSPHEVAALKGCDESERNVRFVETWTLKEAYLKALGVGLSAPLDDFTFVFDGAAGLRLERDDASLPLPWRFDLFAPSERHRLAVAIGKTSPQERRLSVRVEALENGRLSETNVPLRRSTAVLCRTYHHNIQS